MNSYDDSLVVKDALQVYFSKYHFPNGGYDLKWFKIKLGRVYIPLPNTKDRIAAVRFHDIHHLLTEYEANLKGEAEIAGWEIASGCGRYYMAWILNFGSFFYGMFFFTRPLYRAFMRGRKARTNFYYNTAYDDLLLNKTIGEVRRLTLNDQDKNHLTDHLLFIVYCLFLLTVYASFFFLIYQLFIWIVNLF